MAHLLILFCCLALAAFQQAFCHILLDLEESFASPFVLQIQQIHIPGYPNAFNSSIIRWKDDIVLTFRHIPHHWLPMHSQIGIVRLGQDFCPLGIPQILSTCQEGAYFSLSRAEDARLVCCHERLYIVFCDNTSVNHMPYNFRVHIAELREEKGFFFLQGIDRFENFQNMRHNKREKNWVPFDYQGNLLLAYSINPHRILRPLLSTKYCEEVGTSENALHWPWGELRGGTPGMKIDGEYLAFFHSSLTLKTRHSHGCLSQHYFIGAYTFSDTPPFEILRLSTQPIVAKGFYSGASYTPYWRPVNVVFPCGYIVDEQYIWLSYGRQDHEIWVAKIDKKALMESLAPIR